MPNPINDALELVRKTHDNLDRMKYHEQVNNLEPDVTGGKIVKKISFTTRPKAPPETVYNVTKGKTGFSLKTTQEE